jgi:diadenosine tetraphosphatase ApaH/serine/threonine PP2A family protein phosphatase
MPSTPYLILSDIHANIEALQAVLADAHGRYDRILCLGDFVDYGADPNAVVAWACQNATMSIRGNHDRVAIAPEENLSDAIANFGLVTRTSTIWTRSVLTPGNREFIEKLPRGPLPYEGLDLVHGSPADEDEYLITPADAALVREDLGAQLTFFGHTHRQGGFLVARRASGYLDPARRLEIETDHFYLVNPGSVGQPRDGDPRAAYALYWPSERVVEFHRVAYDIDRAAAKIRAAGLPDFLAARLFGGT